MRGITCGGKLFVALAVLFGMWLPGRAAADVSLAPVSQARSIEAIGRYGPFQSPPTLIETDTGSASGFEWFQDTAFVEHSDGFERYKSSAAQDSQIGATWVRAEGSGSTFASGDLSVASSSVGNSLFSFTFDLLEASAFTLEGTLIYDALIAGNAVNSVGLSSSSGGFAGFFLQQRSGFAHPTNMPFSTNGVLPPGRYTLTASSRTDSADGPLSPPSSSSGSYSLLLNVPEPSCGLMMGALGLLALRRARG